LRTRSIANRNAVTVGDHVKFAVPNEREGVQAEGVIESVEPRHGELKRVANRREHTICANVDQAVIVTTAAEPEPKPHLVDRYIVSASYGGITPIVCMNKADLVEPEEVQGFLALYESLGYQTLATSATTGEGADRLRDMLKDRKSVIAGQSGVGKSSLLNAVQPGLNLKIGGMVEDTTKGRHTTTLATLIKLEFGGFVVDTPGVRSFDLSCLPFEQIEEHFVEFVERLADCKFADCTHLHEAGCAIKLAVEQGEIHPQRYDSYVRLFSDPNFRHRAR
jgi:ribosome biogenesis GTPase